jgi:hypothetical protein
MILIQEYLVNWIINPEELITRTTPTFPWILDTGQWTDSAFWLDNSVWID